MLGVGGEWEGAGSSEHTSGVAERSMDHADSVPGLVAPMVVSSSIQGPESVGSAGLAAVCARQT